MVAIYLAGKLAYRMRDVLLMILVAGFVAVILNPMVNSVQRRVRRRGWAVTIVIGWATLVFIGLAVLFGHPLFNGVTHLSARLPSYVQDAADGHGWIGQLVRHFHLQQWVAQNAPKLQTLGTSPGQAGAELRQGRGVGARDAPDDLRAVPAPAARGAEDLDGAAGWLSPARAERWSAGWRGTSTSRLPGTWSATCSRPSSAACSSSSRSPSSALPFPLLWALWVALVDFLPMVGGALAGIPTVLFATAHSLTDGIVMAAVFVAYQQLENHVLNPLIMSRTVKVNPLLVCWRYCSARR